MRLIKNAFMSDLTVCRKRQLRRPSLSALSLEDREDKNSLHFKYVISAVLPFLASKASLFKHAGALVCMPPVPCVQAK